MKRISQPTRFLLIFAVCLFLLLASTAGVFYARSHNQESFINQNKSADLPTVELLDDGQTNWVRGSGKFENIPLGTSVEKEIVLVSNCSQPLSDLCILPSCACTRPQLQKDVLKPGESSRLTFVYNSHNRGGDVRGVFVIQSKEAAPYRVDLIFSHAQRFDDGLLRTKPDRISWTDRWAPHLRRSFDIDVELVDRQDARATHRPGSTGILPVAQEDVTLDEARPAYLKAVLTPGQSPSKMRLSVTIDSPPPGLTDVKVVLRVNAKNTVLRYFVPVHLMLGERYSASPQMLTACVPKGQKVEPKVIVTAMEDKAAGEPKLSADGAWKINKVEKLGDKKFLVRLAKNDSVKSDYPSGRLLIGGDQGEPPLVVPIHVSYTP